MKEYFFNAPFQEKLPQGMVWERFLKYVGERLNLPNTRVSYVGAGLISNERVVIEGCGGVGNKGFHYTFEEFLSIQDEGKLGQALDFAAERIRNEKPNIFRRFKGVLYSHNLI